MLYSLCKWNMLGIVNPETMDWYIIISNSGYATSSYWDGETFDRNDVVYWSPTPTE